MDEKLNRILQISAKNETKDKATEILKLLPKLPDLINSTYESIVFEWIYPIEQGKYLNLEIFDDGDILYARKLPKQTLFITEIEPVETLTEDLKKEQEYAFKPF